MKKLGGIILLTLTLVGCEERIAEQEQVQQVASSEEINYSNLAEQQLTAYMQQSPSAFNTRSIKQLEPYVAKGSEADRYLRNKLPSGHFDRYKIDDFSIDQMKSEKTIQHIVTTRIMSSQATGDQWKKVITVYDLVYNPVKKTMLITDFNDKVIYTVDRKQEQALRLIEDKYKNRTEKMAGGRVQFVKADPAIEKDVRGTYYRFKSVDKNNKLISSYKYYQKTGEIIAE
ncbi:hypothetical protein ERX37_09820 [Macrococcus hajekii]|uniref:TcaA protein NTF2-like domain-containing protein n=1 Tax=Macrococcus hajekii TaxID=198482 RepID=A0A4V3BE52_9STAP|nr:hypothetical protein [Macrococcus hajekii]TDM01169.1 hypothetical protein ERX37_09820 [Macrococcus hajekii]GGB11990.1 hypothetical protein GCM10007190_20070 [Macrococcus hajekii]